MDMEIDTESAAAAVSELFAVKKREETDRDEGLRRRGEDEPDEGTGSNRLVSAPSNSKCRNGVRCIAKGCPNRAKDLLEWREQLCVHGVPRASCECRAEQPFQLHHLNRSSHRLTMLFAALLLPKSTYKRIADSGCLPSYHWRVCSDHFHKSHLGNQNAFPILGIGKTHAQIREIVRELGMDDELPPNFDQISLEPQRLVPCFSFPRAPGKRRFQCTKSRSSFARSSEEVSRRGRKNEHDDAVDGLSSASCDDGCIEGTSNSTSVKGTKESDKTLKCEPKKRHHCEGDHSPVHSKKRKKETMSLQRVLPKTGAPCAVSRCTARVGDEMYEMGIRREIRFFGLPFSQESAARWILACKRDRSTRQYWMKRFRCMARAGKRCFRLLNNFMVCECHFLDGRPTLVNPDPSLRLSPYSFEHPEAEKPKCAISGCNVQSGTRNPKSKENADYELYRLPEAGADRFRWLAAIRKGTPLFPTPSLHTKVYICERHFSTKRFANPVKHLTVDDDDESSSDTESTESDSANGASPNETSLSEEQKARYRSLMLAVLQRRPLFKCLVRCCPVTNHAIKSDRLFPYVFFDLPRIPKVRGRWLDALYHFDEEFQFPPPLIGCGKYAICERHFAFGKVSTNCRALKRLPLSTVPSLNLSPRDAARVELDLRVPEKPLNVKSIARCVSNVPDQQLRREMKALCTKWCCREVPEVHKLILRLSSKIDRLYELIVQLCRIYDVEPVIPPEFDVSEDDRLYGRGGMSSVLVNSAEGLALEKAVEGLMELTRFDAAPLTSASQSEENDVDSSLPEPEKKEQRAESKIDCQVQENVADNAESQISLDGCGLVDNERSLSAERRSSGDFGWTDTSA
uniref:Beta-1,3-glucosyltransferase n=3 Tax=Parascaris univalens TaxID=6257 RepID=A0A915CJ52_PARUN